jgi:CRP/FNR family cyclic AMP-dependent transcriptional regulator
LTEAARLLRVGPALEGRGATWRSLLTDSQVTLSLPVPVRAGLVARCPLFRGLTPEALEHLAREASVREVRRRQVLVSQGDPVSACCVVSSGLVKVQHTTVEGDDVIVRLSGTGEPIAGIGSPAGSSHTATVTALEPTRVLV